jgi:hypothetical protein
VHLHFASAPALAGGLVAAACAAGAELAAARGRTSTHP